MKKEQILLLTNKFIGYYDDGMKYYFLPNDVVDNNNKFKFDILCIQLNKVIKNLHSRKFYLFYVDPKFDVFEPRTYDEHEAITHIKSTEELDNFLYQKVDTEEYEGRVYSFNDTLNIILKDKYNSNVLCDAVNELKEKVFICDLFEPLNAYSKKHKFTGAFMFFFENLYFYYIFKKGKFVSFSYQDRTANLEQDDESSNLKSNYVMSDLGTLISSIGHIRDDLKSGEKADFILFSKLAKNETLEEYLKTLSFDSFMSKDDINSFLSDELRDKPIISFNKEKEKTNGLIISPYFIYAIFSIVILGLSIFKYVNTKEMLDQSEKRFIETNEEYEELLKSSETIVKNEESDKKLADELEEIRASYDFIELDFIDKIYNDLKDIGDINNIEIYDKNVVVSLVSENEFTLKNYYVVKKFSKEGKFYYTLRYKND